MVTKMMIITMVKVITMTMMMRATTTTMMMIMLTMNLMMIMILITMVVIVETFVLGPMSLIKNKTQTAVLKIVSFRIFINLTFRMLFNIYFQR